MGNVTSMDLRSRIVRAVEVEGMSRRGAAERFMVCPSTAIKLLKHKETTGGVAPKKIGGRLHNLEPHRDMLRAIVEETPDMTLERIANEVVARGGLRVGKSSVDRMLKHMGFRIKKKPDRRRSGCAPNETLPTFRVVHTKATPRSAPKSTIESSPALACRAGRARSATWFSASRQVLRIRKPHSNQITPILSSGS